MDPLQRNLNIYLEYIKEEYKDKLLGQGKIFDMYLLDSSSDISYEIKETFRLFLSERLL